MLHDGPMTRSTLRGRAPEVSGILATLRRVQRDGHAAVVVITGEAGIGKTAVVRTAMEQAARMGFATGYGKAEEVDQIAPGAPLLVALRSGSTPLLDGTTFTSLAPLQAQPLWLVDEITGALDKVAHDSPVLVALDDMQWSDRLTRFAVRLLYGRLACSSVVWMLSSRGPADDLIAELELANADGLAVQVITLGPLADDDLDVVARDVLGAAPEGILSQRLHDLGGNPFLAVQLLEGAARLRAAGRDPDDIPDTFVAGIRTLLAPLSTRANELLRVAAVWGRPLSIGDAGHLLLGTPPLDDVLAAIEENVAAGLVTEKDDTVTFRHDLVRQAVYADISSATRRALHRKCAYHLVASNAGAIAAAPHARASIIPGDDEAIGILRQAAVDSRTTMPEAAVDLIREVFDATPVDHPLRLAVGEQCADILSEAQHGREAVAVVDQLLADGVDSETEARLQVIAARALWLMGLLGDTGRRVDDALTRVGVSDALRARLTAAKVLAQTRIENSQAGYRAAQAVLRQAEDAGDEPAKLIVLQALGEIAKNEARHQIAYAHFHQLREAVGTAYLSQEIAELQLLDRFDEAEKLLNGAEQDTESNAESVLPSLLGARLWQDFFLGRYDEATADAHTLIRLSDELGTYVHKFDAWQLLSCMAALRGEFSAARALLSNIERVDEADADVRVPGARLIKGYITAHEGDPATAVTILKPLMDAAAVARNYWPRSQEWMSLHASIAVSAGDDEFASAAALRADLAAERNPGVAGYEGVALHVRGLLNGDAAVLGEAIAVLRRCPRPQLLAYALASHGGALLVDGPDDSAIASLDEAWTIFDRIGHTHNKDRVQRQLEGVGVQRRHWNTRTPGRPSTGFAALTTTERLVAELISQGLTNRAAATKLGISINTVGTHLRSVFTKLEVQSRVQLANAWNGYHGQDA
jgi:DNA-binding CsgD family transcriptional regulator